MKTKQPQKIVLEVVFRETPAELGARRKLRCLIYHAAQMLQQMKHPTADYAIVLHNLRGEVERMQRWDSTTQEGNV